MWSTSAKRDCILAGLATRTKPQQSLANCCFAGPAQEIHWSTVLSEAHHHNAHVQLERPRNATVVNDGCDGVLPTTEDRGAAHQLQASTKSKCGVHILLCSVLSPIQLQDVFRNAGCLLEGRRGLPQMTCRCHSTCSVTGKWPDMVDIRTKQHHP